MRDVLQITIPSREFYDEEKSEFIYTHEYALQLEHSLVSLSKWESKWCKPFLGKQEKTMEETIDYVRCMTTSQNVPSEAYDNMPGEVFDNIRAYISAPMTATWFNDRQNARPNREVITAEIIYYWMIAHQIPMECQKWHLNRLLTLIRVCNIRSAPQKKMGKKETVAQRNALNAARRKSLNTKG